MIDLNIPGRERLQLEHLVLDLNGTLAVDGRLIDGVAHALKRLESQLSLCIVTANTRGALAEINRTLNLRAETLTPGDEAGQKAELVRRLGAHQVAAIGQGANDAAMLREAAIGIAVLSPEGLSTAACLSADVLAPDILSALELLEKPLRLVATLRT